MMIWISVFNYMQNNNLYNNIQMDPLNVDTSRTNNGEQSHTTANTSVKLGATIVFIALVIGVLNLAFIIPSLIYAYEDSICVTFTPDGFSFNLALWLKVDAYLRVALVGTMIVVGLISCLSTTVGLALVSFTLCVVILYGMFQMAWLIVGAYMFWGKVNPLGICYGGVQQYLFAMLIISFVGICCQCLGTLKTKKNN